MNQNDTNDQGGCGSATNEEAMEQELEQLIDGNEAGETDAPESNEDESNDNDVEDPCAEIAGCGGGAPAVETSVKSEGGGCGSGSCGG